MDTGFRARAGWMLAAFVLLAPVLAIAAPVSYSPTLTFDASAGAKIRALAASIH